VLTITGGVGYQAFNMRYLFITPEALIHNIAGGLVGPLINFKAIQADYLTANARQLQAVYNYQRVIINAFTEVINRISKVENYSRSIEIKKQRVAALEKAVVAATSLYQLPRGQFPIDYLDVLTAQNELFDAILDLIDTKGEQLSAVVNTYQALGGGAYLLPIFVPEPPRSHDKWWQRFVAHSQPGTAGFPGQQQGPGEPPPGPGEVPPPRPGAMPPPGAGVMPPPGPAQPAPGSAEPAPGSAQPAPGAGDALPAPGLPGFGGRRT
jgi:hypothetical protein